MIALELFCKRVDSKLLICHNKNSTTLPTSSTSLVSRITHVNKGCALVEPGCIWKEAAWGPAASKRRLSVPIRVLSPYHEGQSASHVSVTKQQRGLSDKYSIQDTKDRKGSISYLFHCISECHFNNIRVWLFSCVCANVETFIQLFFIKEELVFWIVGTKTHLLAFAVWSGHQTPEQAVTSKQQRIIQQYSAVEMKAKWRLRCGI